MAVKGSVPNPGTIVPHLVVRNMQKAVEFYTGAFSARVLYRSQSPTGEGERAHLRVWSSLIQVSTEESDYKRRQMVGAFLAAPESLGGSTCVFQVGVPDVDAAYQRAVDHGAFPALPPIELKSAESKFADIIKPPEPVMDWSNTMAKRIVNYAQQ